MGRRGPKPKGKVKIQWSENFAYVTGLLVTDGSMSNNGRHISFVTKDLEQAQNFKECLGINVHIGLHASSSEKRGVYYRVQFGDVLFYNFLLSIGVTPRKSKTIHEVNIPKEYFFDYLRGCFDGDGSFYSYWDLRWKSSHMFYLVFSSASEKHVQWLQSILLTRLNIKGSVSNSSHQRSIFNLRYAKKDALAIIRKMYYNPHTVCLSRKYLKIQEALQTEKEQQKKYISV